MLVIGMFSQGRSFRPIELAWKANRLLWETPGRHCWLEGGRSSLLESAQ